MTKMTKMSSKTTSTNRMAASYPRITPIEAIRANCLECGGGGFKAVLYCTCDGLHGEHCHLWIYRSGCRPETIVEKYGPALVTPEMMPDAGVCEDDLPKGMEAAVAYLARTGG
jgi:hypothetical protein